MYTGGSTISTAKTWATTLTEAIKTGTYSSSASGWLDGIDITDPVTTAMSWAQDSNAFVCTTVIPNGVSAVENVDLSGDYYTSAMPVIEEQIAKAGYRYVLLYIFPSLRVQFVRDKGIKKKYSDCNRLAAWLNLIATGETGL
jgi:hypothetical protein